MGKRLLRWAWNGLAAMSLVLCVATLALWVCSYWVQPGVSWTEPQRLAGAGATRGSLFLNEVRQPPGGTGYFGPPHGRRCHLVRPPARLTTPNLLTVEWRLAGFEYFRRSPPLTFRRVVVPCWPLALALATVPALWYRRRGRRRRVDRGKRGLCPWCGYDLTGNESGVCPECGTAVPLAEGVRP